MDSALAEIVQVTGRMRVAGLPAEPAVARLQEIGTVATPRGG
jgi:hypothetical protein